MRIILTVLLALCVSSVYGQDGQLLQDVSVTVSAKGSQGSGIVVTRDLKLKKDDKETVKVNFIWTAAHVVDGLRTVKTVVDPATGTEKKVIQYSDAEVVKEFTENGRKVGETRLLAKVIAYSDADSREDLAVLMLYKKNFINTTTKFYLGDEIPNVGTQVLHVGSLLGQFGSGSLTSGIVSQVGRVFDLDDNAIVFDQSTAPAFPGSSGGGMFFADGPNKHQYLGMLVRGADATFNFYVPMRRIKAYAQKKNLEWLLDEKATMPVLEDVLAKPIDDVKVLSSASAESKKLNQIPFLIKKIEVEINDAD